MILPDQYYENEYYVLNEALVQLEYSLKEEWVQYLFESYHVFGYISLLTQISVSEKIVPLDTHLVFDSDGYSINKIVFDSRLITFVEMILNDLNYSDLKFNQNFAKHYANEILSLREYTEEIMSSTATFSVPIVSIFAVYLIRYLITKYHTENIIGVEKDFSVFVKLALKELFEDLESNEIQEMLKICTILSSRFLGFWDEIESGKWVNNGRNLYKTQISVRTKFSGNYQDAHTMMIQILFIISEDPNEFFKTFIQYYSIDGSMNELLNGKQEISEKDITNIKLLLYQISLFTNERAAFSKWCTFCKRFNYEDNPIYSNEETKVQNPMTIRSIK